MDQFEIIAERRDELGKSAIRRLRKIGAVPGVMYGAGKDAVPLKVEGHRLKKQLENEAFFSHILKVTVDGEETQAVLKDLQRDPTTMAVTHLDLLRVSSEVEINMNVPLHFLNEDTSPGKKHGGVVSHLMVDVEITCLPRNLPEFIPVDMGELDVGDSLHLSDIKVPEGVVLVALSHGDDQEHDHPIVTIQHPQKLDLPEDEEAEAAEDVEGAEAGEEGEAGAEGAPEESEKPSED